MKRSRFFAPLMAHRDIGPVYIMSTAKKKDIFSHHQIIVDGHDAVMGLEILPEADFVADRKTLPASEIGPLLNNELTASMMIIHAKQPSAN